MTVSGQAAPLPPPPPTPSPIAPWHAFEAIPVFMAALIASTIAGILSSQAFGEEGTLIAGAATFEASLAAAVLLWIRWVHRGAFGPLGPPERPWRELARGVVGGVGIRLAAAFVIAPIVVLVTEALTSRPPVIPEQVPPNLEVAPAILLGVVVVVGAPLGEELFFRGFLYRSLRGRHGFWLAGGVSSAAFGVVHVVDGSWFLVPIMFGVGMCLAFLYERSGRILTPIAAHAAFNLIGILYITLG